MKQSCLAGKAGAEASGADTEGGFTAIFSRPWAAAVGGKAVGFLRWKNWHYCRSKERVNQLPVEREKALSHAMSCMNCQRGGGAGGGPLGEGARGAAGALGGNLGPRRNLSRGLNSFSGGAAFVEELATARDPASICVSCPTARGEGRCCCQDVGTEGGGSL